MNRLSAALTSTLLLLAGLVVTAGTAHADPYPGTVATVTSVSTPGKVKRKKTATVCATVTVQSGTGTPVGTLTMTITRNTGGYSQTSSVPYAGGRSCVTTARLKHKGGYTVGASFSATSGAVYDDSAGAGGFDVKKKHRHH